MNLELPATLTDAARRLRARELSVRELTDICLRRIDRLQPTLNAFITVMRDAALAAADRLDAELRSGTDRGPLHGIPIVHKDNISFAGVAATVGAGLFRERVPSEDASIVAKLKAAGTVAVGKTSMGEFGTGSAHGRNPHYGDVHNPWRLDRSPGGSSHGTAVAVASGLCLGGTGTDATGSLRGPAARAGVVGIRATNGRISLRGIWPRTRTLGGGGVMARTVEDAAHLLNAVAGHDPDYPGSVDIPAGDFTAGLAEGVRGLTLGVIENYTFEDVDEEVALAVRNAIDAYSAMGARIVPVNIAPLTDLDDSYHVLASILRYEFSRVMSDIFFGNPDRERTFGMEAQRDIARGYKISDAQYDHAVAYKRKVAVEIRAALSTVDALIMPALPDLPPLQATAFRQRTRFRQFTQPFSCIGLPSLVLPCGFSAESLPIGLQLVAGDFREGLLLRLGTAYQRETGHHLRRPPVYDLA